MSLKVRVFDVQSGQVLFECPLKDAERAYTAAAGFEAMGLEVKVEHPSVNHSLAETLGVEGAAMEELQGSLDQESEEHPGSCCYDKNGNKVVH